MISIFGVNTLLYLIRILSLYRNFLIMQWLTQIETAVYKLPWDFFLSSSDCVKYLETLKTFFPWKLQINRNLG